MTGDHDALLAAVLAQPDDDQIRLVYADYEEEYGDPARAEFIRAQIKLVKLECKWSEPGSEGLSGPIGSVVYEAKGVFYQDAQAKRLVHRVEHLEGTFGIAWSGCPAMANVARHQPGAEEDYGPAWRYRRGFIESISPPMEAFMRHAGKLFSRHPITSVTLADRRPAGDLSYDKPWRWYASGRRPDSDVYTRNARFIPASLCGGRPGLAVRFTTEQEAMTYLDERCVAHGRAEAAPLEAT